MYRLLRPALFALDPERAHQLTLRLLALPVAPLLARLFDFSDPRLAVSAFGLTFRNPVGLAAGYDKNGLALRGLAMLGFGHIEAGTVTRTPQPGNPRPRLFRLPADEALINRMGFPNDGVRDLTSLRDLSGLPCRLGVNIGKSKDTPLEQAADDYCALLKQVAPYADYVALNLSSPNTPGLRQLQTKTYIADLLGQVAAARDELTKRKPVLIKIAPDLSWPELDDILEAVVANKLDGIIATNTTISREGLRSPLKAESGGLSGQPLRTRSTEIIRYIHQHTEGKLPIVGVGGINSAEAALEKLRAGATLLQIYTGLIYEGPGLVAAINRGITMSQIDSSNVKRQTSKITRHD
ncbi:MAG: quinone-dependent dihydroorotate dehydrogenase [Chloroflexi bacterium]|nr:quinone-dependent dihydroorotate dehydrogenase [Chloroflexota bacterium]